MDLVYYGIETSEEKLRPIKAPRGGCKEHEWVPDLFEDKWDALIMARYDDEIVKVEMKITRINRDELLKETSMGCDYYGQEGRDEEKRICGRDERSSRS